MKTLVFVILISILIKDNSLLSEENYLIIDNFDEILLNGVEYEIQNEIIKIQLSEQYIHYNFKAILKGETEFYYNINNELLESTENSFTKILEKSFILNYSYEKNLLNNSKNQYIYINIKEPEKHKVILKIESPLGSYDSLFHDVTEDYCKDTIKNIKGLLENAYVFSDYAKNPKGIDGFPDYFQKVDAITDLENVETKNRKYYEFYRDIEEILGKYKDIHLNIISKISPNNVILQHSLGCNLFNFKIINENDVPKLYILPNLDVCTSQYSTDEQNFIIDNSGEPLLYINGKSPFDFIQDFPCNKFRQSKNRHATFSFRINTHQTEIFSLAECPLLKEELSNIKFDLENGKSITIDYKFIVNTQSTFTKQFNDFYFEQIKNNTLNINFPKIYEVEQKYLLLHNIVKEKRFKQNIINNNFQIAWNVEFEDSDNVKKFKCRFDQDKNLNVFYQNSFIFQSIEDADKKFISCIDLFNTNDYPIVIIQSRNGGGYVDFALELILLLQPRIENNIYISYKSNKLVQDNYKIENSKVDTCENSLKSIEKAFETDDYEENVKHKRTLIYNYANKPKKKIFNKLRTSLINTKHSKKPTDILIFTDSFSYSATSLFIKGLHNEGGAIIAGYLGNPNIKGKDEFDDSQSPSTVYSYENTDYYTELDNLGFIIQGVTTGETFLNPYEKNQIPLEYQLNPVDERINFYQPYADELEPDSDDNYNIFVDEATKIFAKYKTQCNPKNKKLTLFADECNTFEQDKYAHGGKVCGDDGKWSNECVPIYCDIGYYYDDYNKKCQKDACLNGKMINSKIINLLLLLLSLII